MARKKSNGLLPSLCRNTRRSDCSSTRTVLVVAQLAASFSPSLFSALLDAILVADLLHRSFAMRLPLSLVFLFLSFCSSQPIFSQTTVATSSVSPPGDGRVAEWMYGEHIPPTPGLPFSAKVELELVDQLQDGTLITHKTYNSDARDSLGRTRNEGRKWINPADGLEPTLTRIELYDPSTKTRTNLFPVTKTARQWTVGFPVPSTTPSTPSAAMKPETSKENIGTDAIEGLPVRG